MPLDAYPTVPLRLSADQIKLIDVGLSDLIAEDAFVRANGNLRRYPLLPNEYARFDQRTAPTANQMASFRAAHQKIHDVLNRGGRLNLSPDELSACIFGTRHTDRLIREKHIEPWKRDQAKAGKRVRNTLERLRKRAKRAFIRDCGAQAYESARQQWLQDLAAVRRQLAPSIHQRKQPRCIRMKALERIERAVELAIEGLRLRGFCPPEGRLLRPFAKDWLRLIRRRNAGTQDGMLEDRIGASFLLADYIIPRFPALIEASRKDSDTTAPLAPEESLSPKQRSAIHRAEKKPPTPVIKSEPRVPFGVSSARSRLESLTEVWWDGQESEWSRLTYFQRCDVVSEIASRGLSNYEIGNKLGCDEGTVRRMRKVSKFPKEVRTQIARGKSVNRVLREEKDPALQQRKRLHREQADHSVSDQHSDQVLGFVTKHFNSVSARQVVIRAKEMVRQVAAERLASIVPKRDIDGAIERLKPPANDTDANEQLAEWLAGWLLTVAPEPSIHLAALEKALKALPGNHVWGRIS